MLRNLRSWSDVRTKLHGLRSFVDYFTRGGGRAGKATISRGRDDS
jgi:hypothetical protein